MNKAAWRWALLAVVFLVMPWAAGPALLWVQPEALWQEI
jgi:hypothetical protein